MINEAINVPKSYTLPSLVHFRASLFYAICRWCVWCNWRPMRYHMCSMRERSGEAAGQGSMSIPFTLLRVLRMTCGRTSSCWNNEPEAACTNCWTTAKKIWLTYRPIVKPKAMCRRAVRIWLLSKPLLRSLIRAVHCCHPGSCDTRLSPSFVHGQKRDSSGNNVRCHLLVQLT